MTSNTYWGSNGKYQEYVDKLESMIPASGPVASAKKNPALEKFRKGCNCYYDLYNNGLYNRAREFYFVFGFPSSMYRLRGISYEDFSPKMYDKVEAVMDTIIINAAIEQGLHTVNQLD